MGGYTGWLTERNSSRAWNCNSPAAALILTGGLQCRSVIKRGSRKSGQPRCRRKVHTGHDVHMMQHFDVHTDFWDLSKTTVWYSLYLSLTFRCDYSTMLQLSVYILHLSLIVMVHFTALFFLNHWTIKPSFVLGFAGKVKLFVHAKNWFTSFWVCLFLELESWHICACSVTQFTSTRVRLFMKMLCCENKPDAIWPHCKNWSGICSNVLLVAV